MKTRIRILSALVAVLAAVGMALPARADVHSPYCGPGTVADSCGFSGYSANNTGQTFYSAITNVVAPTPYASTCLNDGVADWVGIKNKTTNALAQIGIENASIGDAQGGAISVTNGVFVQFVGGPWDMQPYFLPVTVIPGRKYILAVNRLYSFEIQLYIQDTVTGVYTRYTKSGNVGDADAYAGAAGFLEERGPQYINTYGNKVYPEFMNHSGGSFSNASAFSLNGTQYPLGTIWSNKITMWDETNHIGGDYYELGHVGSLIGSGNDFFTYWDACGFEELV